MGHRGAQLGARVHDGELLEPGERRERIGEVEDARRVERERLEPGRASNEVVVASEAIEGLVPIVGDAVEEGEVAKPGGEGAQGGGEGAAHAPVSVDISAGDAEGLQRVGEVGE